LATFEETVLALNPVLFWRCKDLAGSQITDYSGNDFHGDAGPVLLGQQSAVETDPAARSVYIPNGFANNICEIAVPPAELLFTGNFTIACFVRHQSSSGFKYLFARGGGAGSPGDGLHFLTTGLATRTLHCWFVTTDGITNTSNQVSASVSHLNDVDYFAVVTRNADVVTLYLNAEVVGQDSGLSIDPLEIDGSDRITFGSGANNLGPLKGWASELMIFDYALTETQQREVYESALNVIFLNGRSDANPTAILRSNFDPDPVSYPWRHNWTEILTERIAFRSAISQAVTGSEEATGERLTPRRELEFTQVLKSQAERRKLRALLWANQHAKWFIPVRQYAEQLLEPLATSATVTPITTAYKDYEDGRWIGFREVDDSGNITHWEERVITALNPNSVEHEPLVNSYVAYRSSCYPVRRALLPPSLSIKGHTDIVEELTITARLLPEDEVVPPNRITAFIPAIKYRDYEVFDGQVWQSNDWSEEREYEVERAVQEMDFDTGLIRRESDTPGASEVFSYRMVLDGHENIAQFLGWFYERRGALAYLWVPTAQDDFEVLSSNTGEHQITVRDTNYSDAFALAKGRRDLAFVYWDGSMRFRRVIAFEGTVNETLTLDATLPSFVNLRFVSLLKFCRLDADQLELAWHTDNKVVAAWRFRELLTTPEGTGRSSLSPSASMSVSLSPSSSPSPSSSISLSRSPSASPSPSASESPSSSQSPSSSESGSQSPSSSVSRSPSSSTSPSSSPSPSV
jgi:hypothetical protein